MVSILMFGALLVLMKLKKNGMEVERKNLLNPNEEREKSHVELCLSGRPGQ